MKRTRTYRTLPYRDLVRGRTGLPSVQLYYWAAHIKSFLTGEQNETVSAPDWLKLGRRSCENASLGALFCSSRPCSEPVCGSGLQTSCYSLGTDLETVQTVFQDEQVLSSGPLYRTGSVCQARLMLRTGFGLIVGSVRLQTSS